MGNGTERDWAYACKACVRRHGRIVRSVKRRYDTVFAAQGGVCKACGLPPTEGRVLHIDVDDRCWLFRGLVHGRCNVVLGIMGDDAELLRNLADYLDHAFDGRVIQPKIGGLA